MLFAAPAAASPRRHLAHLVNQDRIAHDLPRLHLGHRLTRYAERHARAMARRGYLFHDDPLDPSGRWTRAGENVGVGSSLVSVEQAFMNSPEHRRNVLGPYDRFGVGIVRRGDTVWIVEVFVDEAARP